MIDFSNIELTAAAAANMSFCNLICQNELLLAEPRTLCRIPIYLPNPSFVGPFG
jgi:hypothetical protein